ncbi:hypothetical protein B296_00012902 [Ensete ventricosum]|uniref:Uncharacterized protein n=1 Tax=Ensete ventricosum TaxID=4639 RepID=A0A426ZPQ2_ENSVE|nr:hypothetical protein B296_00012902 [Ensete ventricosum]
MIGSERRRCLRGGHMHALCMQRWLATARPPAGAADRKGQPSPAQEQRRRRRSEGEGGPGQLFEKKIVMPLRI